MSNDLPPPRINQGKPESFGWLRRSDLDTSAGIVYEAPDGKLMLFERGREPALVKYQMPSLRDRPKA